MQRRQTMDFMKLRALLERNSFALLLVVVLSACSQPARASNAVCPAPVGGQVTCEDGQLAYCKVNKDTGVDAGCRTPPKNLSTRETKAWTLSQVLGKEVSVEDTSKPEYANILRKGTASIEGSTVSFKVPTDVMEKFDEQEKLQQKETDPGKYHEKIKPNIMKQENPKQ